MSNFLIVHYDQMEFYSAPVFLANLADKYNIYIDVLIFIRNVS